MLLCICMHIISMSDWINVLHRHHIFCVPTIVVHHGLVGKETSSYYKPCFTSVDRSTDDDPLNGLSNNCRRFIDFLLFFFLLLSLIIDNTNRRKLIQFFSLPFLSIPFAAFFLYIVAIEVGFRSPLDWLEVIYFMQWQFTVYNFAYSYVHCSDDW